MKKAKLQSISLFFVHRITIEKMTFSEVPDIFKETVKGILIDMGLNELASEE